MNMIARVFHEYNIYSLIVTVLELAYIEPLILHFILYNIHCESKNKTPYSCR